MKRHKKIIDLNFMSEKDMDAMSVAQIILQKKDLSKQIRAAYFDTQDEIQQAFNGGNIEAGNLITAASIDLLAEYQKVEQEIQAIVEGMACAKNMSKNKKFIREILR